MRKVVAIGAVVVGAIIAVFLFIPRGDFEEGMKMMDKIKSPLSTPTPNVPKNVDYKAKFSVTTNGTKRIFTNAMYHNLDDDVYIPTGNTSSVVVKKSGIVWADLFESLPMSLDKDCLITGTGQEFCSDDDNSLKFYLDDEENPDALDMEIMDGDELEVVYE